MKLSNKLLTVLLFPFLMLLFFAEKNEELNRQKEKIAPEDSIPEKDVLQDFQKINAPEGIKPPTDFRKGHVSQIEFKNYLEKQRSGFKIKLPSASNVPTPTFYKGKIYMSGGFGSKEYYAFDAKTGEKIWAITLDDDGPSVAAITDDVIVFNTESCTIFACDAKTGKMLWSYWLGDPLMSMPTIDNGMVFSAYPAYYGSNGGNRGYEQQLNYNNINIPQQQMQTKAYQEKQILLDEPNVPSGTASQTEPEELPFYPTHVLAAFDLKTGKIIWQKWIDGDVMSAPVAEDEFLYVTTFSGTLLKFNQETGEILSAKATRATSAPVILEDGLVFSKRSDSAGEEVSESIVRVQDNEQGINLNNPQEYYNKKAPYLDKNIQQKSKLKEESSDMDANNGFGGGAPTNSGWQRANDVIGQSNVSSLQSFQGSRAVNYKNNNYNTMGDELISTNAKTGEEQWRIPLDGDIRQAGGFMGTPPVSAGGFIVIATYTGDILVIDAKSGELEEKYSTGQPIRYQPIVAEGWIYATSTQGTLIAINTKNKKLDGWHTWGADPQRSNKN